MTEDFASRVKNWDRLSEKDKIKTSEMYYRRQMIKKWGYKQGDSRLTAGDKIEEEE